MRVRGRRRRRDGAVAGAARGPRRQRRRLPAPAGAEHALPLLRQHHRRVRRSAAVAIRARAVVTNQTPTGLNRGFGGQQLYFGLERLMDAVAARTGLDVAEVRRRNLVDARSRTRTPTGGHLRLRRLPGARSTCCSRRTPGTTSCARGRTSARAEGAYYGIGIALVVDPSGTNIGYVGLATPAAEREAGAGQVRLDRARARSVDLQGVVTVLLGSVPQGQGHATVARAGRRAPAGPAGRAGARGRRDGHRHDAVDGHLGQLLLAVRAAGHQRAWSRRRTGSRRRCAPGPRCCSASTRPDLELADGTVRAPRRPGASCRFRHAAGLVHWDPGVAAGRRPRAAVRPRRAFTPPRGRRGHRGRPDQLHRSATASSPRWSSCGSTRDTLLGHARTGSSTVHDAGTVLEPGADRGPGARRARPRARRRAVRGVRATRAAGQPTSATFLDYLCPTSAETAFELVADHVVDALAAHPAGRQGLRRGLAR